jgi:hypothetical protein
MAYLLMREGFTLSFFLTLHSKLLQKMNLLLQKFSQSLELTVPLGDCTYYNSKGAA